MATMTLQEMKAQYGTRLQVVPRAVYSRHGDYLGVVLDHGDYLSDRVDEILTLHRHAETNQVIGFTLKGMSIIAKQILESPDQDEVEDVALQFVVLAAVKTSEHLSGAYLCLLDFPLSISRQTLQAAVAE